MERIITKDIQVQNSHDGDNSATLETDTDTDMLQEAVKSRGMRNLLTKEAVDLYRGSLESLGVHPVDIERNTSSLAAALDSPRNHVMQRIEAVYGARRAADRLNNNKPKDLSSDIE